MAAMTRFAILLGGKLVATPRLLGQLAGARVIAADSGMAHAGLLGLNPELWVGDFDSADAELVRRHGDVPREIFPPDKDATDGSLAIAAAIARGGDDFVLAGGLGGQADHTLGHFGQILYLARTGLPGFITSGDEEAHPIISGATRLDIPPQSRLSLIPFTDLAGLTLEGVKWPLAGRDVPLGSTLTLSNIALGPVRIELGSGHAIAVAYPPIPDA
jgi:thiamine pyrophosphokinase